VVGDTVPSVAGNLPVYSDTSGKHIEDIGLSFNAIAPYGTVYYFSDTASDVAGYKTLVNDLAIADDGSVTVACTVLGGTTPIEEFITDAWGLNLFLQGINTAGLYFSSSVNQNIYYVITFYKRTSGGVETSLQGGYGKSGQAVTGTPVRLDGGNISTTFLLDPTDRIVVKISAAVQQSDADITLTYGSSTYPSFCTVPLGKPGNGDMLKAVYDPNSVEADVFDTDNHVDGDTNGVYTLAERSKLAGIEDGAQVNVTETDPVFGAREAASFAAGDAAKLAGIEASADVTDATNVAAAGAIMASLLTAQGSIIYRNATVPAELGAGTVGQVLTSGGAGADPSWEDASGGLTHPQIMARISIGF